MTKKRRYLNLAFLCAMEGAKEVAKAMVKDADGDTHTNLSVAGTAAHNHLMDAANFVSMWINERRKEMVKLASEGPDNG